VRDLDFWVFTAAEGLAQGTTQRIYREARSHVDGLMRDEGLSLEEAVRRLGDPIKARERFRETYITTRDLRELSGLAGNWSWRMVAVCLLTFGVLFGVLITTSESMLYFGAMVVVMAMGLLWLAGITTYQNLYPGRMSPRRLAQLYASQYSWCCLFVTVFFSNQGWYGLFALIPIVVFIRRIQRMSRKLNQIPAEEFPAYYKEMRNVSPDF